MRGLSRLLMPSRANAVAQGSPQRVLPHHPEVDPAGRAADLAGMVEVPGTTLRTVSTDLRMGSTDLHLGVGVVEVDPRVKDQGITVATSG